MTAHVHSSHPAEHSRSAEPTRRLYTFVDEGGNLDFAPTGTRYFTMSAITTERPFAWGATLAELKYELIDRGCDIEYFHACEDAQQVRNRVFEIISKALDSIRLDCVVVDKRDTPPRARHNEEFYPNVLGRLVHHVMRSVWDETYSEFLVFTDALPVSRKRQAVEKAVKKALATTLPAGIPYRIMHHASKSSSELQVADYCNWAVFRKWERKDLRSYELIREAVKSEFSVYLEAASFPGISGTLKFSHGEPESRQ